MLLNKWIKSNISGTLLIKIVTRYLILILKKSLFIGYGNKLRSNFGMLQSNVLINLFKSYCCSFYGSHLWKFNSTGFDKCCKAWNIAIRKLLELPYNAHVYLLGPLVKQINIRELL